MKTGDKVKCISKDTDVTVGNIYTVEESFGTWVADDEAVCVRGDGGIIKPYYKRGFEVVEQIDDLQKIKDLSLLAESYIGKTVQSGGSNWRVDGYKIFLNKETAAKSSASVRTHFNNYGYCVAVSGSGRITPIESVKPVPTSKTINLNEAYDAIITKDTVRVGCQTISRAKILELYKEMESLQ